MPTLGPALDACLLDVPWVSGTLLSPAASRDVTGLMDSLPDAFRCGGLECRLQGDERVDVVACAERRQANALLGAASDSYCGELLQAWLGGQGSTATNMSAVWIEFDRPAVPVTDTMHRSPWLDAFAFFRVAEAAARRPSRADVAPLFEALGSAFAPAPREASKALKAALPADSRLLHLAALRHRGRHELRAHIEISARGFDEYLSVVLKQDHEKQRLLRHVIGNCRSPLAIQLSSTSNGFQPISVELSLPHDAAGSAQWDAIFSRLVEVSLASPLKARAVRAWQGTAKHRLLGAPAQVQIDRLFHVTLRFDAVPAAKAYLYFYPRYVAD